MALHVTLYEKHLSWQATPEADGWRRAMYFCCGRHPNEVFSTESLLQIRLQLVALLASLCSGMPTTKLHLCGMLPVVLALVDLHRLLGETDHDERLRLHT